MKAIHNNISKINKTVYQIIADKYQTNAEYVGKINRGERIPTRGKGLSIKKELEKLSK